MISLKRTAKRIMAIILTFSIGVSVGVTAFAAETTEDTYQSDCENAAASLWQYGILQGSDGSFNLDKPLTRAELATVIVRLLGKEPEALQEDYSSEYSFEDVPDWAAPYVGYCFHIRIVNGYTETEFGSSDSATTKQYVVLALRILGYKTDVDYTWATALDKALEIGLISEYCYERYSQEDTLLRMDVALISYNLLNTYIYNTETPLKDTLTFPDPPTGTMPSFYSTDSESID